MKPALLLKIARRLTHSAFLLFLSLLTYHCSLSTVIAGSGLITRIGGATFVQGAKQFWVTSTKPTFSGITSAGASVSGTIANQSVSATADSSGNWSWTPTSDLSGDNSVSISSGSSTTSVTLTIGDLPASIASSSASTLAPAGIITPTLGILGLGIILSTLGLWGFKKTFSKIPN